MATAATTSASCSTCNHNVHHTKAAASLTLQFVVYMTNGTELNFYTSVVGADRGRIKTNVGSDGNAGMVVTTMVRLN